MAEQHTSDCQEQTSRVLGPVDVAAMTPSLGAEAPETLNIALTFAEALKLHFHLGQILADVSAADHPPHPDGPAAANLCLLTRQHRLVVTQTRVPADAAQDEEDDDQIDLEALIGPMEEAVDSTDVSDHDDESARDAMATKDSHRAKRGSDQVHAANEQGATVAVAEATPHTEKKATRPKPTLQEGIDSFLERYRNGFMDPQFIDWQRGRHWSAHELYRETLGGESAELLLAAGDYRTLAESALDAADRAGLLHGGQIEAMEEALSDQRAAHRFFSSLFGVVSDFDPTEKRFNAYFKAVQALPSGGMQATPASWEIATVLPYLARPDTLMFLDPEPIRRFSERLDASISFNAEPNWPTYSKLLKMCDTLMQRLRVLGARDFIDALAFIRIVDGPSR